ncbi:MAG: DEAD/DEAH box helicase [Blastocatellales bacterium]
MKRLKISQETRKKLAELAMRRWEKHRADQPGKRYAPPRPVEKPKEEEWKTDLDILLRYHPGELAENRRKAILFYSFLPRNDGYLVQPGYLTADAVPEEIWSDNEALSAYIIANRKTDGISYGVDTLNSYQVEQFEFVNTAPGWKVLLENAFSSLGDNYYGYHRNVGFWDGLANALVFLGNQEEPFVQALKIRTGTARVELEMQQEEGGIRLSLIVRLAGRKIRLSEAGLSIFNKDPLWLRLGDDLTRVGTQLYRLNSLKDRFDIFIPNEAVGGFIRNYFEDLAEAYDLSGNQIPVETMEEAEPQPRLYLTEEGRQLRALLKFSYQGLECDGQRRVPVQTYVHDAERNAIVRVIRNAAKEAEWWDRLSRDEFGLKLGRNTRSGDSDLVVRARVHPFDFLKNMVPRLAEAGVEVYGEADLKIGRINRSKPTISFDVTSGIDWFDVKTVINYGELEVSLADIRRSLRRKERYIKLADGTIGEIPGEWLEKYKHLFGLAEPGEEGLRLSRHHISLLDQLLTDEEEFRGDKGFRKARQQLRNFTGIEPRELPAGFVGELRPYQKSGYDWLHFLRQSGFGGCLADDMGTGKTVQALCFLQSLKEGGAEKKGRRRKRPTHLLVVPRSLVFNWQREASRFTPDLKVLDFAHGDRAADITEFDDYDIVLTTYGIMLREVEQLREYEFDTIILDEAQAIKNPVSESAKAARLLRGRNRLTLTGTPVENNTFELWSQFAFLNPGLLGNVEYFRENFSGPIERDGDEKTTETLRKLVYPFILRRTKDQVAVDLPPRSEEIIWEEMESAQRRIYNRTRDEYRARILQLIEDKGLKDARFRILEGLLRLRQICNHPFLVDRLYGGPSAKMEALMELIETLHAEGHKALVFSQFVQMLKLIEARVKKEKIPYTYLDGSTRDREARVDEFQNDSDVRLFLISLKAGGVGLNLTAADYVIHVDPWWNPAVEMQATDRAHRIGQDKPVFVYKLMMKDSVEEKILQLQERKRNLVKQLITTEAGFFKSLTADDISELFS